MVVACGVRLSCSVFTVYSVLLSMSLVACALSIALRLQCVYKEREHDISNRAARPHGQSV